jgi:hypothetical protein
MLSLDFPSSRSMLQRICGKDAVGMIDGGHECYCVARAIVVDGCRAVVEDLCSWEKMLPQSQVYRTESGIATCRISGFRSMTTRSHVSSINPFNQEMRRANSNNARGWCSRWPSGFRRRGSSHPDRESSPSHPVFRHGPCLVEPVSM